MQKSNQTSQASLASQRTRKLTIGALCVALAFVLNQISLYQMPMGGSVTPFSMLFIVLAGYILGPMWGIMSGIAMGLLNTATGAFVVHPMQYLLDYILGFGALGLSGFFRNARFGLHIGCIVGILGRFTMSFLSGYFFFYMWAPDGMNYALYSFLYNITYIGPELVATLAVISIPVVKNAIERVAIEANPTTAATTARL